MAAVDFSSSFAGINSAIDGIGKKMERKWERDRYAEVGTKVKAGDLTGAADGLLALGDVSNAAAFLKLNQDAQNRQLGQDATRALGDVIGGGLGPLGSLPIRPAATAGGIADLGKAPASLVQNESGGDWTAQNDAVGAGGARGHFGRLQFGQARLQEAAAAGALPQGITPQAFMQSPELQKSAENWHFGDIDQSIKQNGFDQLVGKTAIGGVPVTVEGLRAVAHLGGKEGMRKFVETNGAYNPADENGTRLSDYFARHGGGQRVQVAQGNPDLPAPGANQAALGGNGSGFAVPGTPSMSGRTFDAVTAGEPPLQPVFQSEGASQPWMGSALQRQQPGGHATRSLPPQRPYDLGADLPAPGAVPAVGQMPQAVPPDLSNTNDAGARAFATSQGASAPNPFAAAFQPPSQAAAPGSSPMARAAAPALDQSVARSDRPAPGAVPAQGQAVLSSDMPRPTNATEWRDVVQTRQMESAKGQVGKLAAALANPNLPANARSVGEIFLKEALEASKAPDSVKEFMYAKGMGWTTAKSPAEYAKEKTKTSPAEETEGRKGAAAAAGLKPGDPGYQGFILTGKMPREDMGPLTATDKKAILEADEGVLAANTAIEALRTAKKLSPQALGGWGASAKASVANNLPDWIVPDGVVASPQKGEATAELENVVTSQALAQLKSIFGAAPTEGERKILMEIQGSIGQPDSVRQKVYDRGIAMAEKRLAFNQQRAAELRGGDFYKSGQGKQSGAQAAPSRAEPPQQRQPVSAPPPQAIEFLRSNPRARAQFDAKYGAGASSQVLGQ